MAEDEKEFDSWVDNRRLLPPPHSKHEVRVIILDKERQPPAFGQEAIDEESARYREMLNLVYQGETARITEFMTKNPDIDINKTITCNSSMKRESALSVAVSRDDAAMVQFLTSLPGLKVSDCVLQASQLGHLSVITELLDFVQWSEGAEAENAGCEHSVLFPSFATPLTIAAIEGHFGLVQFLVLRGHKIAAPHAPDCSCKPCCAGRDLEMGLQTSYQKLHTFEALCSPAFILATAKDPFLKTFLLHQELTKCAKREYAFRNCYLVLAQKLAKFSESLIACSRTYSDVNQILCKTGETMKCQGCHFCTKLPRLQMAIECNQKEFVAHPSVQQVVHSKWVGDSPSWASTSTLEAVLHLLARVVLLMPFLVLLLIVAPFSAMANRLTSPVNRLVSHLAAYLVFLALVTAQGHIQKNITGRTATGFEPVIGVFLLGQELNLTMKLWQRGYRGFFRRMWNIYDLVMVQLFLSWMWFWYTACSSIYNDERKFWPPFHPVLLSEGLLAVATIVAYGRLLSLIQLNRKFGPMQVSLSKMFADVAQCSLIFFAVILSFSAGVGGLYQYYEGMSGNDNGFKVTQPASFTSLFDSLKFLFWGVFGMSPPEYTSVVVQSDRDGTANRHYFTQAVGSVCFAVYMLIVNVMLLNVLVAKMTITYKRVTENVELEWTFGATEMVLDYMNESLLPPPLNLIPTTRTITQISKWICRMRNKKARSEEPEEEAYDQLMAKLKNRYIASRVVTKQCKPPMPNKTDANPKNIMHADVDKMTVSSALTEYFDKEFASMRKEISQVQAEVLEKFNGQKSVVS